MKCPSEVELNEYAEDRLTTERRWEVERHLQDCPGCRTDLEGLEWATLTLGALLDEEPEAQIHPALEDLAALREGKLPPVQRAEVLAHLGACPECASVYGQLPCEKRELPLVRHWQPMAAAAGLLLVIGLVFFTMREDLAPGLGRPAPAPPRLEAVPPADRAARPEAGAPAADAIAQAPAPPPLAAPRKAAAEAPAAAARGHDREALHKRLGPPRAPAPATAGRTTEREQARTMTEPRMSARDSAAPREDTTPLHATAVKPLAPGERAEAAPGPPPALPPVAAAPGMPAPPAAAARAGRAPGAAGPAGATRGYAEGMAQNVTQRPLSLDTSQKLEVVGTYRPLAAPPPRAPGAGGKSAAGAPLQGKSLPARIIGNVLRLDARDLELIRNDPQRKAQLKAILQEMLKQERSGEHRTLIREVLRSLEAPSVREGAHGLTLPKCG